jgi:hypothetical protein
VVAEFGEDSNPVTQIPMILRAQPGLAGLRRGAVEEFGEDSNPVTQVPRMLRAQPGLAGLRRDEVELGNQP